MGGRGEMAFGCCTAPSAVRKLLVLVYTMQINHVHSPFIACYELLSPAMNFDLVLSYLAPPGR